MNERWQDYIGELKTVTHEELELLDKKVVAKWMKKWIVYLVEGGDRPKHPPRVP